MANCSVDDPAWRDAFIALQERRHAVFSAAVDGRVYARHGTSVDARVIVIDSVPAVDPTVLPPRALEGRAWARNNVLAAFAGSNRDSTTRLQVDQSLAATRKKLEAFADIIFASHRSSATSG